MLVTHMRGPLHVDPIFFQPSGLGGTSLPFDIQGGNSYEPPVIEMALTLPRRRVVVHAETLMKLELPSLRTSGLVRSSEEMIKHLMPGDIAILRSLGTRAAPKNINDDQAQRVREWGAQLLFQYAALRNEILSLPNLDDSVHTYFSEQDNKHSMFCGGIFRPSLRLSCKNVCTAVIAARAIKAFHEVPSKEAFIFPSLSELDDWAHYPKVRRLKDIAYIGKTGACASAAEIIQSLRTRKLRRDVARKFVAGFVDAIFIESSLEDDKDYLGKVHAAVDIRKMTLAANGVNLGTVLHETEHLRFQEIIPPLLESGLLAARATDEVITKDDLPGNTLQRFVKIIGKERLTSQESCYALDTDISRSEPAERLLTELFAVLRQADGLFFHAGDLGITGEHYKMSLGLDIMILKKAADKLVKFDPLLQAVVDTHVAVALQQCGLVDPTQALLMIIKLAAKRQER